MNPKEFFISYTHDSGEVMSYTYTRQYDNPIKDFDIFMTKMRERLIEGLENIKNNDR